MQETDTFIFVSGCYLSSRIKMCSWMSLSGSGVDVDWDALAEFGTVCCFFLDWKFIQKESKDKYKHLYIFITSTYLMMNILLNEQSIFKSSNGTHSETIKGESIPVPVIVLVLVRKVQKTMGVSCNIQVQQSRTGGLRPPPNFGLFSPQPSLSSCFFDT